MHKTRGSVRRAGSTLSPKTKGVTTILFPCDGSRPFDARGHLVGDILDQAEKTQSFEVDCYRGECFLRGRPKDRKRVDGIAIGPMIGSSKTSIDRCERWKIAIAAVAKKSGVSTAEFEQRGSCVIAKLVADVGAADRFSKTWSGQVSWPNLS